MKWMLVIPVLLLPGCLNISASLQPEDVSVKETRIGGDCVPIIFGLAYGHASLEAALRDPVPLLDDLKSPKQTVTKVRRVQLHDYQFVGFGARCVEVVGE